MKKHSIIKTDILNCFGFKPTHKLSVEQVHELLAVSRNPWLSLYYDGTPPDQIKSIDDYAIGHAGLKYRDMRDKDRYQILLTTDKAKTVDDAVEMAQRGAFLFGKDLKIKLEVLCSKDMRPVNRRVIEATRILCERGYHVWSIINYDEKDIATLADLGVEAVRILRGAIGCNGAVKEVPDLNRLGKLGMELGVPIILEGGIGDDYQVYEALTTQGIEAVLVNSCLFKPLGDKQVIDPIYVMKTIRHAADLAANNEEYHEYKGD